MEEATCLETAALVAEPVFPNSVRWSEENLLAAAAGHLVTIVSPSSLAGPRGYITLPKGPQKDIGAIANEDLSKQSVLPLRLRKEVQTQIRSIDWSPQGFAPDGGCLLAVCTSAHDVKIFRKPTTELTSEWIEAANISALHQQHCVATNFADAAPQVLEYAKLDAVPLPEAEWQYRKACKSKPLKKQKKQLGTSSKPPRPKIDRGSKEPALGPQRAASETPKAVSEKGASEAQDAPAEGQGNGSLKADEEMKQGKGAGLKRRKSFAGKQQEAGAQSSGSVHEARLAPSQAVARTDMFERDEQSELAGSEGQQVEPVRLGKKPSALPEGEMMQEGADAGNERQSFLQGSKAEGASKEGVQNNSKDASREQAAVLQELDGFLEGREPEKLRTTKEVSAGPDLSDLLQREGNKALVSADDGAACKQAEDGALTMEEDERLDGREKEDVWQDLEEGPDLGSNDVTRDVPGLERVVDLGRTSEEAQERGRGRKRGREPGSKTEVSVPEERSVRRREELQKGGKDEGAREGNPGKRSTPGTRREGRNQTDSEEQKGKGSQEEGTQQPLEGEQAGLPNMSTEKSGATAGGLMTLLLGADEKDAEKALEEAHQADDESEESTWQLGSQKGPVLLSEEIVLGSRVEVLMADEGLKGAWFSGTVVKMSGRTKAQVEYDELLADEKTGEKLQEWIPLRAMPTIGIGELPSKPTTPDPQVKGKRRRGRKPKEEPLEATASRTEMRPRIRPEVSRIDKAGHEYAVGDHVEASYEDAWWEGLVTELSTEGRLTVFFPGEGDLREFEGDKLRLAWGFEGSGWSPFGATRSERKKQAHKERAPAKSGRGRSRKETKKREKPVKLEVKALLGSGGIRTPHVKKEPKASDFELPPPGSNARAQLVREQERLGMVLCERFKGLREREPAEALPKYEGREHLKGRDRDLLEQALKEMLAEEGDLLSAAKLSVQELVKIGRRYIRQKIINRREVAPVRKRTVTPKPEPDLVLSGRGKRKKKQVNYADLDGLDREHGAKDDAPKKRQRKGKEPEDDDQEFVAKSESEPEEDLESDGDLSDAPLSNRKKGVQKKPAQKSQPKGGRKKETAAVKNEHIDLISAASYAARSDLLAALTVAWSPRSAAGDFTLLAVGAMSGHVTLWKVTKPSAFPVGATAVTFVKTFQAHASWVSALGWAPQVGPVSGSVASSRAADTEHATISQGLFTLATGSSDGSIRLWSVKWDASTNSILPPVVQPVAEVCPPSGEVVTSLSLQSSREGLLKVAAARGAGELLVWEGPVDPELSSKQSSASSANLVSTRPSGRPLMGLSWAPNGEGVFTCTQEGCLQRWQLGDENRLLPVTLSMNSGDQETVLSVPTAKLMRGYTGIALSPNGLAIAGVRRLALGSLDLMYQAKAMRGALQVILCGRGSGNAFKTGAKKRPRVKLSAAAEKAIKLLSESKEQPPTSKDWVDEFLPPPVKLTTEPPPQNNSSKENEALPQVEKSKANETGEEKRQDKEKNQEAAERLTQLVLQSVESLLNQEGPIVLWDVTAALKELGLDALQRVLKVLRKIAWGEEAQANSDLGDRECAEGNEPLARAEVGRNALGEPSSDKDGKFGLTGSEQNGAGNGSLEALGGGNEEEAAAKSQLHMRRKNRALQLLYVLLRKLGHFLEGSKEPGEKEANPVNGFLASTSRQDQGSQQSTSQHTEAPSLLGVQQVRDQPEWKQELERIETELRVQLAQALLSWLRRDQGRLNEGSVTSALLWADWANQEATRGGLAMQQLTKELYEAAGSRSPPEGPSAPRETCPLCSSPVPLDSPDTARCSNTDPAGTAENSVKGHLFKRCMVTMLICASTAVWQCTSCKRSRSTLGDKQSPLCVLCGILMYKPVPEALLKPTAT